MSKIIEKEFNRIVSKNHKHRPSVYFWLGKQLGLMITVGKRFDKRYYIAFDFPFFTVQFVY